MDAIETETHPIPPTPIVTPPQARLPGEKDLRQSETLYAPVPDAAERAPCAQPTRSHKKAKLVTVAIIAGVGIVTGASYEERAHIGQLSIVQRLASTRAAHDLLAAWSVRAAASSPTVIASKGVASPLSIVRLRPTGAPSVPPTGIPTPDTPAASVHAAVPFVRAVSLAPTASSGSATAVVAMSFQPIAAQDPGPAVATTVRATGAFKPSPPNPKQVDLREFDALRSTAPNPAATGERASPAPSTTQPLSKSATAVTPARGTIPASAAPVQTTSTAPTTTAEAPASTKTPAASTGPAPSPLQDPVAEAPTLKPAPMALPQQLDLLHLMTEMGIVVRDLRKEDAELHDQVAKLSSEVDNRLTQFDRRLSLAEARGAIAAAMGAGQVSATTPTVGNIAAAPATGRPAPRATAPVIPPLIRNVKDYSIQAASPGLAMLSTVKGDPTSIQVSAGDEVPGVGRVKAIFQRGTQWVVETDHGVIQ